MVSEPSSRMPPSTSSFSPLMTELTAMTVVMPMTMPRTVRLERSRFLRSVSRARATCSPSLSEPSTRTSALKREARVSASVLSIVDIVSERLFGAQRLHGIELRRF